MLRATASLLLVGAVALLITWGVSPAQSQSARAVPRVGTDSVAALPSELSEIDLEVERLSIRMDRKADYPAPARDLFNFSSRIRAPREVVAPVELPTPPVELAPPAWPSLVAIMTKADGTGLEIALADRAGELHVVSAGGAIGTFVVGEITADAITLSDQASGQTTRLSVR